MSHSGVPQPISRLVLVDNDPDDEHVGGLTLIARSKRWLHVSTIAASILAVIVLFGLVGFNALIVRNQGRLDELDQRLAEATGTNQQLRFEIAELEAPDRVRAIAIASLGMVEPDHVTYLEPIASSELGSS